MKKVFTTPLFYVNAAPHLGHAYSAVLADAMARWEGGRLLTGTDEHGQKISSAAHAQHYKDPQLFCDTVSNTFKSAFDVLHIDYDNFVRTTEARHKHTVHAFWQRIQPQVSLGHYEGWYCASDESFVASSLVNESTKQMKDFPHHNVEWTSEPNYKFTYNPSFVHEQVVKSCEILPHTFRANEVAGYCTSTADTELSISRPRSRVPWALAVPNDDTQSVYVWLEALCGYITASGEILSPNRSDSDMYTAPVTHIIGKDILKFHALYWPAFLLAANLPLPQRIVAHAHWTTNRQKMSKSVGNVVDPLHVISTICKNNQDAMRYFLLRDGRLEFDADFQPQLLIDRVDADLGNNLGNLLSRVSADSMWAKSMLTVVPVSDVQKQQREDVFQEVDFLYRQGDFARGLEKLFLFLNQANFHFQTMRPWDMIRTGDARLGEVLGDTLSACHLAGVLLAPVVPTFSQEILRRLNVNHELKDGYFRPRSSSTVLFSKLGGVLGKI